MEDWLKRRLSPVKDKTARWTELSESLQQYWEENFDSIHNDLVNLRSVYTMSRHDLALKMREKGDYFAPDFPSEYDEPLAVAWRESEIMRKNMEFALHNAFRRNFSSVGIDWVKLYSIKTGVYGEKFVTEFDALPHGKTLDDYFMTSRGKTWIDLGSFFEDGRWIKSEFRALLEKVVKRIKPLHIVYDGSIFCWTVNNKIDISAEINGLSQISTININLSPFKRYDDIRADDQIVDETVVEEFEFSGYSYASEFQIPLDFSGDTTERFDDLSVDIPELLSVDEHFVFA